MDRKFRRTGVICGGVEDTKYQVATGESNAAIDRKIAAIERTCGL